MRFSKRACQPVLRLTSRHMSLQVIKFAWPDVAALTLNVVPPLDASSHKGTMGRIGVIGGSKDYCGAPYYAAVSALKFGADLSWVYCSQEAAIPIKSYSPELMVTPFYDDKKLGNDSEEPNSTKLDFLQDSASLITSSFPRLHTLVIGPGLGRHPDVQMMIHVVIREAIAKKIGFVIDADGLNMLTANRNISVNGYTNCILTPNAPEFERLAAATFTNFEGYLKHGKLNGREDLNREAVQYWMQELSITEPEENTASSKSTTSNAHYTSLDGTLHMNPSTATATTSTTTTANDVPTSAQPLSATEAVLARRVYALSVLLGGVTILRKGAVDIIASSSRSSNGNHAPGSDAVYVLYGKGCPRRCGGLGDILSGITATALHWATQRAHLLPDLAAALSANSHVYQQSFPITSTQLITTTPLSPNTTDPSNTASTPSTTTTHNALIHACIFASSVAKKAAEIAFAEKGRSMTAPDVIERIGAAFQSVYKE